MWRSISNDGLLESSSASFNSAEEIFTITPKDEVLIVGSLSSESNFSKPTECCKILCALPWRKRVLCVIVCLVYFFGAVCYSVAFSFLAFECREKGDTSQFSVGMIIGCFELTVFIFTILFGIFIAYFGLWFLLVSGVLVEGFCAALFGVLTWCPGGRSFLVMAIAVRSVEAIGCAMCQTAALSIVAKEFPRKSVTFIGFIEASEGFGFMAGPAIGGALYELGGFQLPFFVTGGCLFFCGTVAWSLLPRSDESESTSDDVAKPDLLKFFTRPVVLLSGLFIMTSAILTHFYDPTLSVVLESYFSMSPALIGVVFILDSIFYPILSPIVGYLSDRFNRNFLLLTIGNAGFLVAYALMGPLPFLPIPPRQLWTIITAITLLGIFLPFGFMPAFPAIIAACKEAGMEENAALVGLISGFFASSFSLGAFIGPFAGGYLTDAVGFADSSSFMCILPVFNLICIFIFLLCDTFVCRRAH